jgi:hypothetical protein
MAERWIGRKVEKGRRAVQSIKVEPVPECCVLIR